MAERTSGLLVERIDRLRETVAAARRHHPFEIIAAVVLPDHRHAVWQLPPGDADYPMRWSLIKSGFSRGIAKVKRIRASRIETSGPGSKLFLTRGSNYSPSAIIGGLSTRLSARAACIARMQ